MSKCVCGQEIHSERPTAVAAHERSVFHRNHKRIKALLANDCMTYTKIGKRFGVSRERIRQIHKLIDSTYTPDKHRGIICTIDRHERQVHESVKDIPLLAQLKAVCEKEGLFFGAVETNKSGKYLAKEQRAMINGKLCSVMSASVYTHCKNLWYYIRVHLSTQEICSFHLRFLKDDGIWLVLPSGVPPTIYILPERNRKRRFETLAKKYDWTQYFNAWHLLREPK